MKILSKWTKRFGKTLRIAQLAFATTLSASLLHLSERQSSTTLTTNPVLANVADSQLYALEPIGASAQPSILCRPRVTVAIPADRRRQRGRHDVVGAEGRRQFLLVANAVLRRHEDALFRIGDRFAQRFDCAVRIVRFGRDDRNVGIVRLDFI